MSEWVSILSCYGIGILLAFTPCMLPMIPIISNIIVGQNKPTIWKSGTLSLSYVLGMALTYSIAGLLIAYLGSGIQEYIQRPSILIGMGLLFILLSLSSFGLYDLTLPSKVTNKLSNFADKCSGGTYIGVFIMGGISSLVVSPCVSAPLVAVLTQIAETGNMTLGAIKLFAIGLGMGTPLMFIGLSIGKILPKSGSWMLTIKYIFGIIILIMAVMLIIKGVRLI